MSPAHLVSGPVDEGFPRVSGDEPLRIFAADRVRAFSPRERG